MADFPVMLNAVASIGRCFPQAIRNRLYLFFVTIMPRLIYEKIADPHLRNIVNSTNIAFIHIPKVGGSSICEYLYNYGIGHRTAVYFKQLDPDNFDAWLKVAVIRDPIDRFLSAFDYLQTPGRNFSDRRFAQRHLAGQDINEFVARMGCSYRFRKSVTSYFHFRPQVEYITNGNHLIVNRLLLLETIAQSLPALVGRHDPVPHLNQTTGCRTKRSVLSEKSLAIITDIYSADFKVYSLAFSQSGDVFGQLI